MEHRMSSRRTLMPNMEQCLVDIYLADKLVARCPVSNIGIAGLGIVGCPDSLSSGMFLKIVLKAPDSAGLQYLDMNALVIWAEKQQAGLMWAGSGSLTEADHGLGLPSLIANDSRSAIFMEA